MPTTDVILRSRETNITNFRNLKGELLFQIKFQGDTDFPHAQVITDPHTTLLIKDLEV